MKFKFEVEVDSKELDLLPLSHKQVIQNTLINNLEITCNQLFDIEFPYSIKSEME